MDTMKATLIIFTINLVTSKCYQFPNATLPHYYVPVINIRGINASIVYLKDDNTDDIIMSSLILGLYGDQSVILSKGKGYLSASEGLLNNDPNIIIITSEPLSMSKINSKPLRVILKNNWSPLYIIITVKDGRLTCDNGKFNQSFLTEIEHCMNQIWHKHRVIRVIVSFPYTCPHHYIIYGEKKESNMGLYNRTIKIIMARDKEELTTAIMAAKLKQLTVGYPLKANIFKRFPTSIKSCDNIDFYLNANLNYSNGYCGLDGLIMHDYVNHYQFNLSIPKDDSCGTYGFEHPFTKRMSGSLSCIIDGRTDISFNSRFMVSYTTKQYFYLHYIATDSLVAILKRPEEITLWHYPYNCFSIRTVFILDVLMITMGFVTWAFAWIKREMDDLEPRSLSIYILNVVTCTLFGFPIKKSKRFRFLRGASLFCSIILLGIYQGNVNYQFTTRTRHNEIKTLNELYNSQNTLYASPSIYTLLVNDLNEQDKDQQAFLNRTQIKHESLEISYVLEKEGAATTERGEDVTIQVLLNFSDAAGSPLMYVVDQPLHTYYLSYICRTGFPFTEETLSFMMRLLEAGLPKMYYLWTRRTFKLGDTYLKKGAEPRPTNQITIRDLRASFILLAAGCVFSTLIFLVELYRGNSKKKDAFKS